MRFRPLIILLPVTVLLPGCGLIKLPFKAVGAVVEGTAYVGKTTTKAFSDTPEEKAEKAKEKAAKEKQKADEEKAKRKAEVNQHADAVEKSKNDLPPTDEGFLPPVQDTGEPLPDDAPLPYQGQ
jgi:hypothetical protein